ncbi:hypothetical protein WBQ88_05265 [Sphingopyxis sp. CCNWLW253]
MSIADPTMPITGTIAAAVSIRALPRRSRKSFVAPSRSRLNTVPRMA